jgi:Domain of unknown function (DUF1843)
MAKEGAQGGTVLVYGVAIGNAIAARSATIDELLALRSHAKSIVDAQGDLVSALTALDKEIADRGGAAGEIRAFVQPTPSDRFVVDVLGLPIPPDAKRRLEAVVNETVKTVLARHDVGGDLVITPLSQIRSYGAGLGGATAGMIGYPPDFGR